MLLTPDVSLSFSRRLYLPLESAATGVASNILSLTPVISSAPMWSSLTASWYQFRYDAHGIGNVRVYCLSILFCDILFAEILPLSTECHDSELIVSQSNTFLGCEISSLVPHR